MAARGGRRQLTWGAPVSWREMQALEAARAVTAARTGAPPSRADWLIRMAEAALREAAEDADLPAYMRQRAAGALAGLEAEQREQAEHPPRPGRRPSLG
jgi:hypothetical protein